MTSRVSYLSRKWRRRALRLVSSRLYVDRDREIRKSIVIAGTARSGTTWLEDVIASQVRCRILFEPFNPVLVPEYRAFNYFQYMRPGAEDPNLYEFTRRVLTGDIRGRWIDRENETLLPRYRLIKEIRANLLLRWLHDRFPQVPVLFILRHPCAVVLSRMKLGWATDSDIQPFMQQPELIADHLSPYMDVIRGAQTDEEKHAVIWCVSNLVPLAQLPGSGIKVIHYEHLVTRPDAELPGIFAHIGVPYRASVVDRSRKPSMTSTHMSAVVTGENMLEGWKKGLSPTQVERILKVVDDFGLGHLYGDSPLPLEQNA